MFRIIFFNFLFDNFQIIHVKITHLSMTSGFCISRSFICSFNKFYQDFCSALGVFLGVGKLKRDLGQNPHEAKILVEATVANSSVRMKVRSSIKNIMSGSDKCSLKNLRERKGKGSDWGILF